MVPDGWKRLFEGVFSVCNLPVSSLLFALVVDCLCLLLFFVVVVEKKNMADVFEPFCIVVLALLF